MSRPEIKLAVERPVSTLRVQVQEGIRNLILDGQLTPGQRISERWLMEASSVSRPVLREALAHLEARGLVEYVPNSGMVVARVSKAKAAELYEVRAMLEGSAAALFAERGADEDLAELSQACDAIEAAFQQGELGAIREATTQYYSVLLRGCGNSEIRTALEPLIDRVTFLRSQSMSLSWRREQSMAEMREITDAILRRDAHAARAASEKHIRLALEAALQRL